MNVSKTAQIWLDYHRAHSKKNTVKAYEWTIGIFCDQFGDIELLELTVDNILALLNQITKGRKPQTKRVRFSHLTAFFISSRIISIQTSTAHAIRLCLESYSDKKRRLIGK